MANPSPRRRRVSILKFIRRIHLYAGLFLLPWVLLYGITAALLNHESWAADANIIQQPTSATAKLMDTFPSPRSLAESVVDGIRQVKPDANITISNQMEPQFTGPMMFETWAQGSRYSVRIDPISGQSQVFQHVTNPETPEPVWPDLHQITLADNPQPNAQQTALQILKAQNIPAGKMQPLGWTKLNFLIQIDGEPARVTYVLRDQHIDVQKYRGEDGMTVRHLLTRLHTSHGQPPHWNARMFWSLIVDTMAIAMVTWALSGLVMWWQMKRLRLVGILVLTASLLTATVLLLAMSHFYATQML